MPKKEWNPQERRAVIGWFASREGADAFADVPVSAPNWRDWPSDAKAHSLHGVAVTPGIPGEKYEDGLLRALWKQLAEHGRSLALVLQPGRH